MGLQQVRGAEGGKGRRRQGLGLLGGNSCLSGHISWVGLLAPPPSHCPMTVILMELDVWEGTPILLFLSSDSLAPLITEIVILSPTHPKPKTTKSESLCCPPLPSPRSACSLWSCMILLDPWSYQGRFVIMKG